MKPNWLRSLYARWGVRPTSRRKRKAAIRLESLEDRAVPTVSTFQQGVNGYTGTQDVELRQNAAASNRNGSGTILIDFTDPGSNNASHGLMKFDNIIGTGPGQVPPGAYIRNAFLTLNTTNAGDGGYFYRMASDWSQTTATWNSFDTGLTAGTDTLVEREANAGNEGRNNDVPAGTGRIVSVTDSIQAWTNGAPNFGWGIIPFTDGTDGWEFSPSENGTAANRPKLTIDWELEPGYSIASFQDGVGGYTDTVDTVIRQDNPDTDNSAANNVFVDAVATAGPDQVLMRFDNIFGTNPGQIPIGATILSASLVLSSNLSNAQGDGGRFYRLLDTWVDTSTWNSSFGGNGIDPGVETAPAFTTAAGNAALNGDPQSNRNVFDVTSDLQTWSDGDANFGWGIIPWPGGGDGWGIRTSEAANLGDRPRLVVYFTPPAPEPAANTVDFVGGKLSFAGGVLTANDLTISVTGGIYTITDTSAPITLTQAAVNAGFTGNGTNTITAPSAVVTSLEFVTGTKGDTVNLQSVEDPISIDGGNQAGDLLTLAGDITLAGDVSLTRFNSIAIPAGSLFDLGAGTLTLQTKTGIGAAGSPIKTKTAVVELSGGDGGVFIEEQDGALFSVNSTGPGPIDVKNLAGTLTIAGKSGSGEADITLWSADGIAVNASLGTNTTLGRIVVTANADGAGAEGYTQSVDGNLLSGNAGTAAGSEAIVITVGGAGDAILGTGGVAGTILVEANGGSILWNAGFTIPNPEGGSNAKTLGALHYDFRAAAGSIGTAAAPIQTNNTANTSTAKLLAGPGGIYLTDWGDLDLTVPTATATGAGNVQLIAANATGHNMTFGDITTGSGAIILSADDDMFILGTIGGPAFSGTVEIRGSRDQANEQRVVMQAGAKIQTSNASATAVKISNKANDNTPDDATYGGVELGDVIVGDGGTITIIANDGAAFDGYIKQLPGTKLDAGANGTVVLVAGSDKTNSSGQPPQGSGIGIDPDPIQIFAGTVVINTTNTSVLVQLQTAAKLTAAVAGAGDVIVLAGGPLTIVGATKTAGGSLLLEATGSPVTVNAPLGDAATGNVTVNASQITFSVPLAVPAGKTYALNAGSSIDLGPTTIVNGTLTAANGVTVGAGESLDGAGSISGKVTAVGTAGSPAVVAINGSSTGQLTTGGFTGSADTALSVELAGLTPGSEFDQLVVSSGSVNLAGTVLSVNVAPTFTPTVGDSFVLVDAGFGVTVSGQFAAGTTITALNNPAYQFSINYAGGDGNDIVLTVAAVLTPPVINIVGTQLIYTGGVGANNLTVSVSGGVYTINDTVGVITLTPAAIAAGFTGSGTNTITGPSSAVTELLFNLEGGDDTVTLASADDSVTIDGGGDAGDVLTVTGTVAGSTISISKFHAIASTAAGLLEGGSVNLSANAIGTAADNVRTKADNLTLSPGAGGAFVTESDGVNLTAQSTGGGAIAVTNLAGTLVVAGLVSSDTGDITLSSADGVAVNANIGGAGFSGKVTIAANTDGAGSEGYIQAATATITTANISDTDTDSAVRITVNTAAGGTGDATLAAMSVGVTSGTPDGGRITVNANGGSILWGGTGVPANPDSGSAPARLKADTFAFTTTGAGSIGTAALPIQSGNIGTTETNQNTVLLSAGNGIFWWDWDSPDFKIGSAIAAAGDVSLVSANAGGHNLLVVGNVSTANGNIYLAANDDFQIGPGVTIGGAGMTGTITLRGDRDTGSQNHALTMDATSAIQTSNVTSAAVFIDQVADAGSTITVANITVGNGGTITINAAPVAGKFGRIAQQAGTTLNAGADGSIVLNAVVSAIGDAIGTAAQPITATAKTVLATATNGHVFITESDGADFTVTTTTAGNITLATTAGKLAVAGATNTDVGTISLVGFSGVVVTATLGDANTGAIAVAGPLTGTGAIQLGTDALTVAQDADSTFEGTITGSQGLVKEGTGTLTLAGTSPFIGTTTVNAGRLLVDGSLSGSSGVNVGAAGTLGGSGTITGPVSVSGKLAPGASAGILGIGNLSFAAGGTLAIELNGTTAGTEYDQLSVTGTVDLTGAALVVATGFDPALDTKFVIIANDGTDAVTGTFTGLAEGASFLIGTQAYKISYTGGDGNDVTLTRADIPNDPPVNTVPGAQAVLEEGTLTFSTANGNAITVTDSDIGAAGLKITLSATNGTLTLGSTAGLTFITGDGTADTTMTFTGSAASVNAALNGLQYAPTGNYFGSAGITITTDDQGGTNGAPPATDTDTIAITVNPVNDAPTLDAIANATIDEDAAQQSVNLTGITAGPGETQTITVSAVADNAALIASATVDYTSPNGTATLLFTPAANASGTAVITVTVMDTGGTADGGVNTFVRTFTVVVNPQPDAPNITAATTAEDTTSSTGLVITPNALDGVEVTHFKITGITGGTLFKSDGVTVINDNDFITAAEGAAGLKFAPAADANTPGGGIFSFVAQAALDATGTGLSTGTTATITVTEVNDAPTATADTLASAVEDSGPVTIPFSVLIGNDITGPANESGQLLTIISVGNAIGGTVAIVGTDVIFTPSADFNGTASFEYTVQDNGTTNGAADAKTAVSSASFTVTEVNDAPTAGNDSPAAIAEDSGPVTIPFSALVGNDSTGPANESGQSLTIISVGNAVGGTVAIVGTDVIFTPSADFSGTASFEYTVQDNGTTNGAADAKIAVGTVSFTVTAVNDAPVNTIPSTQTTGEETPLAIGGISIADLDAAAGTVQVTLAVLHGTLTLGTDVPGGVAAGEVAGNGTGTVVVTSTLDKINATLAATGSLSYTPATDYNGPDTLTVTTSDQGNTGSGGALTDIDTVAITVTAMNDDPMIGQIAGTISYLVNGPAAVIDGDATVADVDSVDLDTGTLTVQITTGGEATDVLDIRNQGTGPGQIGVSGSDVTFAGTTIGTFVAGTGLVPLVVTFNADATPAAVEALLRNITFRSTIGNPSPADRTVSFLLTDGDGGTSNTATKTISITFNVPPTLTLPGGPVNFLENDAATALDTTATVTDGDSADFDTGTLTVSFTANGTTNDHLAIADQGTGPGEISVSGSDVTFAGTAIGTFTGGANGAALVVTFNANATPAAVEALVRAITFRNDSEAPSSAARTVSLELADGDGGIASATKTVNVTAVNDAPVNTVPAAQATSEETPLVLGGASAIAIDDADAGASAVQVTLTAIGGTVTLSGTANLIVSGNGTALVVLAGAIADVNAALDGLTFTPAADFNGPASLQVATDDLGSSGTGGSQLDADTMAITVASVNDAPVLTVPGAQTTNEDTSLSITGVTLTDVDAGSANAAVTLSVVAGTGTLTVTNTSGLASMIGNGTSTITLTGTVAAINAAIASGLKFIPADNFNGPTTLTINADDLGSTGTGGALTDSRTVNITVDAVNDAPTFNIPTELPINEDAGAQTLTGFATGIAAGPADEGSQGLAFTVNVTGTLAFLVTPTIDAAGTLVFTVAPNANGTATIEITLTDTGSGTAPNINATTQMFTLTVAAVNDAPTFNIPADPPDVDEDAGLQTVPAFAANFQPGPATALDEAGQTPTYVVTVTGTTGTLAFATAPTIDAAGNLTYAVAANTFGTATISVVVGDSGGTANGGVDTSAAQSFEISVNPVNDLPTLAPIADVVVDEDTGEATVNLTGITAGPGETQTLTITATSSNPGLVADPTVNYTSPAATGTLSFTPAPGASGTATITVTVADGSGGTIVRTFAITVNPVNDAPTLDPIANASSAEDAGPQVVNLSGIGTGGEMQVLTVTAVSSNPTLIPNPTVDYTSPNGTGALTFTPAANASGSATITVTVSDGGDGTNSITRTFTITVNPVNDPVTVGNDTATLAQDAGPTAIAVLGNDSTAPDVGETLTITGVTQGAHGSVAITGGGTGLTYQPAAGFSGADSFTYTVSDGNGGTVTATVSVTVTPETTPPTVIAFADDKPAGLVGANGVVRFIVTFSEPIDPASVTAANFGNAGTAGITVTGISVSGATAMVDVQPTTDGTVQLRVTGVSDLAGNAMTDSATAPHVISADLTAPTAAIALVGPAATTADAVSFAVTFSEAVTGLTPADFTLAVAGISGASITGVSGSGTTWTVTASTGTGSGTIGLNLLATGSVIDAAGNPLAASATSPAFTIDRSLQPIVPQPILVGGTLDGAVQTLIPSNGTYLLGAPVVLFPGLSVVVRTASADVDGDGVADIAGGTGPGSASLVKVVSGATGAELFSLDPFETSFTGGVFITLGDVTGDGVADLVITPDEGGGPRARIFDAVKGFAQVADFFGIEDVDFRGGARAAVGDLNGDGTGDLIVAAGFGGGPRIAAFDGRTLGSNSPVKLFGDFLAFEPQLRNGTYVTAGDFNGDGRAELVAGGGPGGGPRVTVFDGADLLKNVQTRSADFFAGDTANRGGIRLSVKEVDGQAGIDLVVGSGADAGSRVTAYAGSSLLSGAPQEVFAMDAFPGFTGGVYVG